MSARSAKHVAAVAVLVLKDGQVLSLRRAPHKDAAPGVWEALSGRVEPGEDPLQAAQREVLEECGLEVRIEPRPWTAYAADRAGEPMLVVVYRAAYLSGEVVLSDEHDAYAWRTAEGFAQSTALVALAEAVHAALQAPPPARDETGI